jgi:hypothetical protein
VKDGLLIKDVCVPTGVYPKSCTTLTCILCETLACVKVPECQVWPLKEQQGQGYA